MGTHKQDQRFLIQGGLLVLLRKQESQVGDGQHDDRIDEQCHDIEPHVVLEKIKFFKILVAF